jgi:hypothetical protein
MADTAPRKYAIYKTLESSLRRDNIEKPGVVATLLLETFLEDGGQLRASKAIARDLCIEGRFSYWRKQMIEKRWLTWNSSQDHKGKYFSGEKLISYLNREKINSQNIFTEIELRPLKESINSKADSSELTRMKKELDEKDRSLEAKTHALEKRTVQLERTVKRLIEVVDPPVTEEKIKNYLEVIQ